MRRRRRSGALVAVLLAASACAGTAHAAAGAKPKALVRDVLRFIEARESGDLERAARRIAPGARVRYDPRDEVGEPLDLGSPRAAWDRELHATLEPEGDLRVEGRTVLGTFVERSDFWRLLDVPAWRVDMAWRLDEDGRVLEIVHAPLAPPANADLAALVGEVRAWAEVARPHEVGELVPGGRLVRSEVTARRWRELLLAWRAATGRAEVKLFRDGEVREKPALPHGMLDPPDITR